MAHKICEIIDRIEGKEPRICSDECKYFKFPHLTRACVLSEVFSVNKGDMCLIFEPKPQQLKG